MCSDHCAYTASPSPTPSVDPPPSGVSGGVIAGVVIGVVFLVIIVLAVVAVLVIVLYQRRRGLCVLSVLHYFHLLLYVVGYGEVQLEMAPVDGECYHYQEVVMSYSVVCYIQ